MDDAYGVLGHVVKYENNDGAHRAREARHQVNDPQEVVYGHPSFPFLVLSYI